MLDVIHEEIISKICSYLSWKDICQLSSVNKRLNTTTWNESFCKQCSQDRFLYSIKHELFPGTVNWKKSIFSLYRIDILHNKLKISLGFEGEPDETLATLLLLPLANQYALGQCPFTSDEVFILIYRFNKQNSLSEEFTISIDRDLNEEELLLVVNLALSNFKMRLTSLHERISFLCGSHNIKMLDIPFFSDRHRDKFVVSHSTNPHKKTSAREDPWIFLNQAVRIHITPKDKESVVKAIYIILVEHCHPLERPPTNNARKLKDKTIPIDFQSVLNNNNININNQRKHPSMSLDNLRLKFGQYTGMPFGHSGCGSLLSFLKDYPLYFYVEISSKGKKQHDSRVFVYK